ncbi:hypothetical protein [Burkholderia sp. Ax-1719]|nr:hypothetical protein [Burkholderia sp. Ax-1719]
MKTIFCRCEWEWENLSNRDVIYSDCGVVDALHRAARQRSAPIEETS